MARLPSTLTALIQATYLGGSGGNGLDGARALAIHPTTGDVYVAGDTGNNTFPGIAGGAQTVRGGGFDVFVARLPSTLTSVTQSTFLGGSLNDEPNALAIHPTTGDVYVAGSTLSSNFPGTAGGAQPASGGNEDGFVARLPSTLTSLTQATYLGGTGAIQGVSALAIHPTTGDVYVAGFTGSNDFPGTAGGAQPAFGGGLFDGYVARLPSTLTSLTQATYLGGSGSDQAHALAIHPTTGDVYVAGVTGSDRFPCTAGGAQAAIGGGGDAFVARFTSTLTALTQATYLGGGGNTDGASALAIHPTTGDVYVAGDTNSSNFPGTAGGAQPAFGGGGVDVYVARLTFDLTLGGPAPLDLTITKTHRGGGFFQGSTANNYTVIVANCSSDKSAGQLVSVTDDPPSGLTITAMSGTGWTCTTLPTCTRSDVLAAGANYPPITVTVSVATNATSPQVNSVSVATTQAESSVANNTATDSTFIFFSIPDRPDLTIGKTHNGSFTQGSTGNTYRVIVGNSGSDKTAGQLVSVTDDPPSGLTITAMSGTGWTCTTLPTCTRSDVLAAGASYPAITVTVSVAANATSPQVNSVSVSTTQAEIRTTNNTATDSTVITPLGGPPDLTIAKTHTGSFALGSTGNTYTVTVTNSGAGDKTAGQTVTVTDAPPSGLTVTAMSGTGWTCTAPTCTRSDVLAASASYPAITVTVSVAANATSPQVNSVSVTTTQAESNTGNNGATDSTVITPGVGGQPDLTITKTHSGNFALGSTGNTYTVIVTNSGTGDKSAGQTVTVTDTPSAGLTVTAMSGAGWTCTTLPTCTRSDVLAAGVSYPLITVTVSVAANATTPQANSVSVSTAQAESNSGNNGATDITIIAGAAQAIPTLSEWAIIGMGLLLVAVAVRRVRRRAPTRV